MTTTRQLPALWLDGVAVWTPRLPDWATAAAVLRGERPLPDTVAARPAPALLAANERRRAPDAVLMALEVASQAAAAAHADPRTLPTVFASTHGDLAITDALCRTLAGDPALLSPTRFHHSVHNAGSGYWAIGAASPAASTALAAHDATFAAGWLEAATQALADGSPVMLVAGDTEATGPLTSINRSRGLLALALVLSPRPGPRSLGAFTAALEPDAVATPPLPQAVEPVSGNAMDSAWPLLALVAAGTPGRADWPLSASLSLALHWQPGP